MAHVQLPLEPQTGGTLDPAFVVGRDELVLEILNLLRKGTNVLITDPRRIGKTSVLGRIVWTVTDPEIAILVDFEGVDTVDEFLRRLITEIRKHAGFSKKVRTVLGGLFDNIEVHAGPVSVKQVFSARSAASILEESLIDLSEQLAADGKTLYLLLDEVPIAARNIAERERPATAHILLQTLRRLRQRPGSAIRWVITGSIGFHHVLRQVGSTEGVVGDLQSVSCGALGDDGAQALADALLRGIGYVPDEISISALIEFSGSIPFLMHHLAHRLRNVSAIDRESVRATFDRFVDDRDASKPFTHLLSRVETFYGDHSLVVNKMLDQLAVGPMDFESVVGAHPSMDREELRRLIDLLIDDHYLVAEGSTYSWRYPILERIWMRRRP
jgi:hypothetical protein